MGMSLFAPLKLPRSSCVLRSIYYLNTCNIQVKNKYKSGNPTKTSSAALSREAIKIINIFQAVPTIHPAANFKASTDGDALRAAMKGFGTDEQAIIDILTARSNQQRQEVSDYFLSEYGRDLIEDLKSELGGKFEDVIVGLMMPPDQYLCKQLHKAMSGMGTNEHALIEILCSKNNEEVKKIVKTYEDSKELIQFV